MTLDNNGTTYDTEVQCVLRPDTAHAAFDTTTTVTLGTSSTYYSYASPALQAVHKYKHDATAEVDCHTLGAHATEVDLAELTFSAISVDSITRPVA
jgi:hypothetical protein